MRKIEIITPQNVPVQFQLANVRERAMAFFFDCLIMFFVSLFLFLFLVADAANSEMQTLIFYCIVFPIYTFYSLFFETLLNGRTPGKAMLKIRVVKLSGSDLKISDFLLRWLFRWIDIWLSAGSLAALQVSSSTNGQRIGDLLADTTVIRQQHDFKVVLNDLLAIRSKQNHEIQFEKAIVFKEEEMLLVKQVLERYRKFDNEAHKKILVETAKMVSQRLNLDVFTGAADEFLKAVLVDYITLTRS
jgi:uncharacterized RDD family membrane protein YckC